MIECPGVRLNQGRSLKCTWEWIHAKIRMNGLFRMVWNYGISENQIFKDRYLLVDNVGLWIMKIGKKNNFPSANKRNTTVHYDGREDYKRGTRLHSIKKDMGDMTSEN